MLVVIWPTSCWLNGQEDVGFTAISSSLVRKICVIGLYAVEFFGVLYVTKNKSFSRKTEAFILIGGGENRTLVLSKRPINAYMLIIF